MDPVRLISCLVCHNGRGLVWDSYIYWGVVIWCFLMFLYLGNVFINLNNSIGSTGIAICCCLSHRPIWHSKKPGDNSIIFGYPICEKSYMKGLLSPLYSARKIIEAQLPHAAAKCQKVNIVHRFLWCREWNDHNSAIFDHSVCCRSSLGGFLSPLYSPTQSAQNAVARSIRKWQNPILSAHPCGVAREIVITRLFFTYTVLQKLK